MNLRAALVDDEPLALARLQRMLEASGRVDVVSTHSNPETALEDLRRTQVDVVFLDIHMPGLDGFQLLDRLPAPPAVIFTTAHPQYALRAFRTDSLDYLLKPVLREHLDQALAKVERWVASPATLDVQALGRALAASMRAETEIPTRIAARLGTRITFLEVKDIVYFHAQDKLTYAMTDGKAHCVDHALADLEQRLDSRLFLRIHRAVLLNTTWVREVQTRSTGNLLLRLRDTRETELEVPKGRAREVRERLGI